MTLATFPELRRLPRKKQLELADELWAANVSESEPVSTKHKKLLDSRWAAYKSGKTKAISLAELERRLAKK